MLLCTDVGNTNIKFALYNGDKLLMKLRFSTNRSKTADDYAVDLYTIFKINNVNVKEISGSIISSVVPLVTDLLKKAIMTVANVDSLVIGPGIKTGLDIRLDNPGAGIGPRRPAKAGRALSGAEVAYPFAYCLDHARRFKTEAAGQPGRIDAAEVERDGHAAGRDRRPGAGPPRQVQGRGQPPGL